MLRLKTVSPIDYTMRLIEQFSAVLSKILFKKQANEYPEALREIENAYTQLLALDPKFVDSMTGRFGKAEDALYELLQHRFPNIRPEFEAFYERMLARQDQELETGNLPRSEIDEGLSFIRNTGICKIEKGGDGC